ncbi:MAG: restriction endonuclease subunit S [Labedaea sp.]
MTNWPTVTIQDVAKLVTKGTTPTTLGSRFETAGVSFVKVESIRIDGRIDYNKIAFIDSETHELLKRSKLQVDDVLFTIAGTIGRVARVTRTLLPANTNQAVAIIRPDQNLIEVNYLLYCLRDRGRVKRALERVVQSVQANLSLSELSLVEIPLPPKTVQRAIAAILEAIDDKIAANDQIVSRIGALTESTWLLACKNGGTIPLSSLARFVNGKAFTRDASGTGRVVIRIVELNSGIGSSTVFNDIDVPEEHLAQPGDLLFAWSGSLTVARWFREEAIINQHIFKVIPKGDHPLWLVNQALLSKLQGFKSIAADKATTMGHIQRHHLDEPVAVPAQDQVNRLDDLMSTLWQRALATEKENLRLENTRDRLLPYLMSGKIRVRDAEKVLEEVV